MDKIHISSKISAVLGILLIAVGLLLNKSFIELLSPDGVINAPIYIYLLFILRVIMVILGLFLVIKRPSYTLYGDSPLYRDVLEEIDKDCDQEKKEEEERKEEFAGKFKNINKIPVFRFFVKWMYKEGWMYSIGLILVLILGFILRLYGIGNDCFKGDEFQVISTAYGYLETGMFYKWDWLVQSIGSVYYERAWLHTWMIAQSFSLFGFSEWSARIPSLIFGTILIPLTYYMGRNAARSKLIGLLLAFAVAFNPFMIDLSRWARMYIIFIPLFLLGSYLLYPGLVNNSTRKFKKIPLLNNFVNYLDFDYRYLIPALIVLYISYLIHINTLLLGVGAYIFVLALFFHTKEKRFLYLFGIMTAGLLFAFLFCPSIFHSGFITIKEYPNLIYYAFLFKFNSPVKEIFIALSSLILLYIFSLIIRYKIFLNYFFKNKMILYYFILTLSVLIFFIFFADRYAGANYISNIMIIAWLLLFYSVFFVMYLIFKKHKKTGKILLSILITAAVVYSAYGYLGYYADEHRFSDYRIAYKEINENYREGDLLMGQYLRTPYIHTQKKIKFMGLGNNKQYPFETFMENIDKYDRIWITWETKKSYHLNMTIIEYVDEHFERIHGAGVDNSKVEVYFLDKSNKNITKGQ
ncbi:MAG: hypothetical protein A7315_06145 [Candidatus Altiarchaeales archaeon WOR_SM1_79]|nr:MAG: hypothetical protein A7315_06145 [Candidatus Altiarchaeales archaeon WOR_SM1_79]